MKQSNTSRIQPTEQALLFCFSPRFSFSIILPPFSLLRDFSFQNTSEHFAIRFRQSYLIREVCDVTAIELSSKE